jgi:hypothetical protein
MNWDAEVDIEGEGRVKLSVTLAEIHSLLLCSLTKGELEEFGGELIKYAKFSTTPILLGD